MYLSSLNGLCFNTFLSRVTKKSAFVKCVSNLILTLENELGIGVGKNNSF